ncbi:MAG: electron transfer flavoprotein subunit beta/FixA family protein [Cyanobacteria bacterium SZAS-4]|nr:electron transfer flavoprotein subunit beta/FixA family protein [Cyanobacteria bacterium SZAS-4]
MKIAVCVKAVPDTEAKIVVAADKTNIDLAGVRFITSPYDEFAVEEALRIKEKHGGETVVISMGGDECTDVIRDSLARGIDAAIHLKDDDFKNLDPLSTGKVLAAAIKDGGYDVILCGQQGVGGDNNQVPSILAELLDLPQATVLMKLEIEGGKFKAEREVEGAHDTVEGSLPALFSAQKGLNEPRYSSIKGVMAARKKEIVVKDATALGVKGKVGGDQRKVKLKEMIMPPDRPSGKKIEGDADTQAKTLVQLLRSEARVI